MTIETLTPKRPARKTVVQAAILAALALFTAACNIGTPITLTHGTEVEGLTGSLVAGSAPAAGARVMLFEADTSAGLARKAANEGIDTVTTDTAGRFSFDDVPRGSYNLAASLRIGDTTYALFLGGLVVDDDTDIGVKALLAAGRVVLQAVSDGQSVEHAVCAIPGSPWSTVSDSTGTCVLEDVAPGTFHITVTHPSFSITVSGDITIAPGGETAIDPVDLEPPPEPLARLIAHWGFDESTGSQALDASGNERHGAISGPVNRAPGIHGTALEFNGATHVQIADTLLPDPESFTFTAWVRESSQGTDQPILDFCCTNDLVGLHLWTNTVGSGIVNPGRVYVNLRADPPANNTLYTATGTLSAGSWNQVALTYDGATRKTGIHVNGTLRDTLVLPQGQKPTLSGGLYLGYRLASSTDMRSGARFIGRLDEVRLYDGTLTSAQLDSLYRAFRPADADTTLVASADAAISSSVPGYPDNNALSDKNRGAHTLIGPGTHDVYTTSRSLIRFRIPPGYSAENITSAVLRVTNQGWTTRNRSIPYRIDLHRMLKDWKEGTGNTTTNSSSIDGVTALERFWGTQDGGEDWTTPFGGLDGIDATAQPSASVSKSPGDMSTWDFDVTELARVWAEDSVTNFGVLMAADFPASSETVADYPVFYSREAAVPDSSKPVLILNGVAATITESGIGADPADTILLTKAPDIRE